jgi:hypothetical protein
MSPKIQTTHFFGDHLIHFSKHKVLRTATKKRMFRNIIKSDKDMNNNMMMTLNKNINNDDNISHHSRYN